MTCGPFSLLIYSVLAVSKIVTQAVSASRVKAAILELKVITSQAVLQLKARPLLSHITSLGNELLLVKEISFFFF